MEEHGNMRVLQWALAALYLPHHRDLLLPARGCSEQVYPGGLASACRQRVALACHTSQLVVHTTIHPAVLVCGKRACAARALATAAASRQLLLSSSAQPDNPQEHTYTMQSGARRRRAGVLPPGSKCSSSAASPLESCVAALHARAVARQQLLRVKQSATVSVCIGGGGGVGVGMSGREP